MCRVKVRTGREPLWPRGRRAEGRGRREALCCDLATSGRAAGGGEGSGGGEEALPATVSECRIFSVSVVSTRGSAAVCCGRAVGRRASLCLASCL